MSPLAPYVINANPATPPAGTDVPSKVPELEFGRQRLEKAISELGENLRALEARLEPILLPYTQKDEIRDVLKETGAPSEVHSQTVAHLRAMFEEIRSLNDHIGSIATRLEV